MVNNQSGNNNQQEQWFPRLPDGYEGQEMSGQGRHGYSPSYGMPGYGMPGYPPGYGAPGYGMPGNPPMHGWPGQGMPGYTPGYGMPGYGMPGHGMPGHGMPGNPPMSGWPGQGMPGDPPRPGHQPGRPPGQQHGQHQAPTSAPPSTTPEYPSHQLYAVDPGAIAGCMYRFTYVWLSRREGFWFYPVFVGRTSVAGYRWRSRQRRWEYTGLDLNNIDRFTC